MPRPSRTYQLIFLFVLLALLDSMTNVTFALGGNPEFKEFNKPQLSYSKAQQKWFLIADSEKVSVPRDLKPISVKHVHDLCMQLIKLKIRDNQVDIVWGAGTGVFNWISTLFKPRKYDCDYFPTPMRLWILRMEYPYTKYKKWGEAEDLNPPKLTLLPCDYSLESMDFFTYITGNKPRRFVAFPYHGNDPVCLETFDEVRMIIGKNWGRFHGKVSFVENISHSNFRIVRLYDLTGK